MSQDYVTYYMIYFSTANFDKPGKRKRMFCTNLEETIVGQVLQGELPLAGVPGIRLPEDGVSVPRNNLPALQGIPNEFLELIVTRAVADLGTKFLEPDEHFLISKTVEGTREAVHTGGEGKVRVGERGANQMGSVRRNVTALMIGVDRQVESHQLDELGVVIAQHARKVPGPILTGIYRAEALAVLVGVPVYRCSDDGELGDQAHRVFVDGLPVLGLVDSARVGLYEYALAVESGYRGGELGHRMEELGEVVEHFRHMAGKRAPRRPLLRKGLDLRVSRYLTGNQEPEETFWERLGAPRCLRKDFLALGDRLPSESDAFIGVQHRRFPNQTFDAPHTSVHLRKEMKAGFS